MTIEEQKPKKDKVISKSISIKEFQMWLDGVEEMQEADWTPDARQWKRIRAKIDTIDSALPKPNLETPFYRGPDAFSGMEAIFPPMNTAPPSAVPGPGVMSAPSALNKPVHPTHSQRVVETQSGLPVSLARGTPNIPTKTPDIDTSSGSGYASQFA
jgi:hypothetical protein